MISVAGGAMSGLAVQILAWRGGMVLEIITFTIGSLNRVSLFCHLEYFKELCNYVRKLYLYIGTFYTHSSVPKA